MNDKTHNYFTENKQVKLLLSKLTQLVYEFA